MTVKFFNQCNGGVFDVTAGSQALASLKNPSSIALAVEMKSEDCWSRMAPYYHPNGHWWTNYNYTVPIHASETVVNVPYADGHAKGVKFDAIETKDFGFYLADGSSRIVSKSSTANPGWTFSDCSFKG